MPDNRSVRAPHIAEIIQPHAVDHLIRGLMELLPKTESIWRLEDRAKWLRLAADIFEVGYKSDGVAGEISIVAVRQVAKPQRSLEPRA
jgi:hypothetical protein